MTTASESSRRISWPVTVWFVATVILALGFALVIASGRIPIGFDLLLQSLPAVTASAVGALILVRRPGHGIGRICLAAGVLASFSMLARGLFNVLGGPYSTVTVEVSIAILAAQVSLYVAVVLLGPVLVGAFPTGRFSPVGRRVLAAMLALALPIVLLFVCGSPTVSTDGYVGANPVRVAWLPAEAATRANSLTLVLYAAGLALATVALALRYRRAETIERLQIRWVAANGFVIIAALASTFLNPFELSELAWPLWLLAAVFVPISVGIAILRYRLYDIDRIISSTVAYGVVTALLFTVFAVVNLGLQGVLRGPGDSDPIGVAVATLLVAALFNPVRTRVQRAVDRRFHRARYDAQGMVDDFSTRLRNELDLGTLVHDLTRTTELAVEPSTTDVWLRGRTALR